MRCLLLDTAVSPQWVLWRCLGLQGSVDIAKEGEDGKFTSYSVSGIISKTSDTVLEITELPVGKWTQDYKEFLEPMLQGGGPGGEPFIKVSGAFSGLPWLDTKAKAVLPSSQ